jgi:hypothetical protein
MAVGDENQPTCSQCLKGGRACRQEATQDLDIRLYQPTGEQTTASRKRRRSVHKQLAVDLDLRSEAEATCSPYDATATVFDSFSDGASGLGQRRVSFATSPHSHLSASTPSSYGAHASNDHDGTQLSPTDLTAPSILSPSSVATPRHLASPAQSLGTVIPFTAHEARLVHHFSQHLGRWLDCTDASRQMTLEIPKLAATSPILLQAVVSYAASHLQDRSTAEQAHERCVRMLIVELSSAEIANDTAVLCAIVILRVFEQLNGR